MKIDQLDQLKKHFNANHLIFSEGDTGDAAYIIQSGHVELFTEVAGNHLVVGRLSEGDLFGEMALVDDEPRTASAKTSTDCTLIVIPKSYVHDKFKLNDPITDFILKVILDRFREVHQRLYKVIGPVMGDKLPERNDKRFNFKTESSRAAEMLEFDQLLRKALNENQFKLVYQPIVDLSNGAIVGCEALIRWMHPEKGLVSPVEFIPQTEITGLIMPIGYWIIKEASTCLRKINEVTGHNHFVMSVNLSGKQFEDPDLIDRIDHIFSQEQTNTRQIKFEITESLLMTNPDLALGLLNQLKSRGVQIAIDDFGTGYSSFSYLHQFPIDTLKIDRTFTSTMLESTKSLEIVKSLSALAKSIGMTVIAEGIEKPQESEILSEFLCEMGQGNLYGMPIEEADLLLRLKNGH